jgi:cysteine-rich repeat protein
MLIPKAHDRKVVLIFLALSSALAGCTGSEDPGGSRSGAGGRGHDAGSGGGGSGGGAGGGGYDAGSGGGGHDAGPAPDSCGDGVVDPGEACDDGDSDDLDACTSHCTVRDPADGVPIDAPNGVWTYVPIVGSLCRDGSPTGIMVNPSSVSDRVMIFLAGGGACFNYFSCIAGNPDSFNPADFEGTTGVFDRANPDNPVRGFSFVYVPYCTGDVHLGGTAAKVPGLSGMQEFRGYGNVRRALERIAPTFKDATEVLLTGVSGGGFGAAGNFEQVQRAFQDVPVVLLDDSGPPMGTDQIPSCLQDEWREMWGLDATVLEECGTDCPHPDDYVLDLTAHVLKRYPRAVAALFSNTADGTIRTFYGFGNNQCNAIVSSVPAADYLAGLTQVRNFVTERSSTFGTYYVEGNEHTCIGDDCFYEMVVDGVALTDFVADLLEGSTSHVGPGPGPP